MAPEPVTADYIHRRIRHEIVEGTFTPGMTLKLNRLTDQFGTSATPVRDAMNRLVGERLVELLPGGGFRVRPLGPDRLAGLYRWHGQLIQLALGHPLPGIASEMEEAGHVARTSEALFGILASVSHNEDLVQAQAATSRMLARARALEPLVIPDAVDELSRLIATIGRQDIGATRRAVARYHRDRVQLSTRIHALL